MAIKCRKGGYMALILNCGFYNTKGQGCNGKFIYPTKIQESEDGSKTLIINDLSYEIGVGTRDISDKQLSAVHHMCTKYSILKYSNMQEIDLVAALPFSLYLNREYRENYKKKLIGTHRGVVDGEEKKVYVRDCTVFAEGAAAYLPYKSVLQDKSVGILDFGGNTINCLIYDRGNLLKETISTLDLGMIKLERTVIDTLNIKNGWNVQEYEVKDIIENNECKGSVDKCINEHIQQIKLRLLEKKWNINRLTIFATGGGSQQLKSYLESAFNNIIVSSNGLWDNVDGLKIVGDEIYGKETYQRY